MEFLENWVLVQITFYLPFHFINFILKKAETLEQSDKANEWK